MRTDISLAQQIVQAAHATLEAGLKAQVQYKEASSIVLIQIPDKETLENELQKIQALGIECAPFIEPYDDMGLTAFATLPVTEEYRMHFKEYTLWGRSIKGQKTPLTEFLKSEMKMEQQKKKQKQLEKEKMIEISLIPKPMISHHHQEIIVPHHSNVELLHNVM